MAGVGAPLRPFGHSRIPHRRGRSTVWPMERGTHERFLSAATDWHRPVRNRSRDGEIPGSSRRSHPIDWERGSTMTPNLNAHDLLTRRHFFGRSATGIGVAALASLLNE